MTVADLQKSFVKFTAPNIEAVVHNTEVVEVEIAALTPRTFF